MPYRFSRRLSESWEKEEEDEVGKNGEEEGEDDEEGETKCNEKDLSLNISSVEALSDTKDELDPILDLWKLFLVSEICNPFWWAFGTSMIDEDDFAYFLGLANHRTSIYYTRSNEFSNLLVLSPFSFPFFNGFEIPSLFMLLSPLGARF